MPFKVACAQTAPIKADVNRNLDHISEIIVQAQGEGADLVQFPETATSGYFLEGGVLDSALTADDLVARLRHRLDGKLDRPIDVVVGFYQADGGNLYNAAAYIEFGTAEPRLVAVYRKFFLPTYGVFDEERFVSRGKKLGVFDTRLGRFAILICEDVWHSMLPTLCALNGAQAILSPSASPGRGFGGEDVDSHDRYKRLFRAVSEEHGVFCVNTQLCGFEGGKGFVGGSSIYDPSGRLIVEGPLLEEHLLMADIDLDLVSIARAQSPLLADLQSAWSDVRRIVEAIV